jgi:hypothetical protein
MRQVTVQKPQRSTVSTPSSERESQRTGHRSGGSSGSSGDRRTYPAAALALMLVVGVVAGLLFAAVISSFVDGSSSGAKSRSATASATPSAISSRQREDLKATQRSDELQANAIPENRDVRIFACGTDADGYASARVLISNGTSRPATYYVRVLFTSAADGRLISDDVASVKRLPAGSTSPAQTVSAVDPAPGETVLCRLGSVTRF